MSYKHRTKGILLSSSSSVSPQIWSDGLFTPIPNPPAPGTTTLWNGDFSTNNFTQWTGGIQDTAHQGTASVGSHTVCSVVSPPAGLPGPFAGRFETFADSTGQSGSKARAEIGPLNTLGANSIEGSSYHYEFWSYFPSDGGTINQGWADTADWNIFLQMFSPLGPWNGPKMGINLVAGVPTLYLVTYQGTATAPHVHLRANHTPLQLNFAYHWHMFITWSTDITLGRIQLFVNDVEVVPLQATQTRPSDGGSQYWKGGMYRTQDNGGFTNTHIMAGARRYSIP